MLGNELRNPAIALRAGMHLMKRHENNMEKVEQVRGQMDRMITHLSRLVEDLLDVSRIDQGKISLKKERVALQGVLDFAVEASQAQIEAGKHKFDFESLASPRTIAPS